MVKPIFQEPQSPFIASQIDHVAQKPPHDGAQDSKIPSIPGAKPDRYAWLPEKKKDSGPARSHQRTWLLAQVPDTRKPSPSPDNASPPLKKNALSPTTKKIARNLMLEAEHNYGLGKFDVALEAFQKGYVLTQNPAFLYNIAQCHRQMLKISEALQSYRDYLKIEPNAANQMQVKEVIKVLGKWEKLAGEFPIEAGKLWLESQRLADQFPEQGAAGYWPDFLSNNKGTETSECKLIDEREKLLLAILEQVTVLMNDEDPRQAWAAAVMLDKIALTFDYCRKPGTAAQSAYTALEGLTQHPRPEMRAQAAATLGTMTHWIRQTQPPLPLDKLFSPPPKLVDLLKDPNSGARAAAVQALSRFRSASELLQLLKVEPSPEVRGALAQALGSGIVSDVSDRPLPLDAEITKALTDLSKENDVIAEKALFSLGLGIRKDPRRAIVLIKALEHPEPMLRLRAANGLENNEDYLTAAMRIEAITKLKKLTGNKLEGPCAAVALAKMGEVPYAMAALKDLALNSEDPDTRVVLAFYMEFLGELRPNTVPQKGWLVPAGPIVDVLKTLLQDKDPKVIKRAQRALEKVEKERGLLNGVQ